MKNSLIYILNLLSFCNAYSQYSVNIDASSYSADFNVKVAEGILYADIDVEIGENLLYEDFTIGFTNNKSNASVIISSSTYSSDININISNSLYTDIDIDVSESQLYEDIAIEIKKSGYVDYLIYNEGNFLSKEQLVVALLPIINAHLDYKFEDIPYWSSESGIGEPEDVLEPTIYCCPALNHWIDEIDGQLLKLEDGSLWIIYEEDTFSSTLWLPIDKVKIKSTSSYGHYYISKYNSISEVHETVRAICVKD